MHVCECVYKIKKLERETVHKSLSLVLFGDVRTNTFKY